MSVETEQVVFEGSPQEQQLAREIWLAMRMMGINFAQHAPIRQPLTALAGFFGRLPLLAGAGDAAAAIDAALSLNPAVFTREETADGVVTFATTKTGQAPASSAVDPQHSLRSRLTNPAPAAPVEVPVEPAAVTRVAEGWLRPASPTTETSDEGAAEESAAEQPAEAAPSAPIEIEAVAPPVVEVEPAPAVVVETPPVVAPPVSEPELPSAIDRTELEAALRARLAADVRLVSFANEWFPDDLVIRLGRNDFRRLKDYINERSEPLADDELLNDVLGRRVTDRDYALTRFGLNVRLSREKKDFDFVGTSQLRQWSTSSLPPIGTTKRKPAELGQDYRFLLESTETGELGPAIDHALTFFEYEYGVLPLDARFAAFFPRPVIEDQRVAALRFEVPQLYTNYLVELRYPTANRGGFIGGLDQFYAENLVPGAVLTIERTDNDGRYLVKFGQTAAQERKLLHLDERRGRFVFRPVTYYCAVNEDLLLSDTKFAALNNTRPLDDKERRRPEVVLRTTFERVGDQVGEATAPRYWALADDLLAATNIERPFTAEYLRAVLTAPNHPEFERDPDGNAYFYDPLKAQ